jgi:cyclic pyranopterin monophosphate synthase
VTNKFTHLDESGSARMVDVSEKLVSVRSATATGKVKVNKEVIALVKKNELPKGDLYSTVRLAGIMAAKKTSELIPLCHPLAISSVEVEVKTIEDNFLISATVKTADRTGVEMEALTAVSVAALTVIDMVKAIDKGAEIYEIQLIEKTGGKSGTWTRS